MAITEKYIKRPGWVRTNRFAFLLVSIVLFMILRPFVEGLVNISFLMEIFISVIFICGIYAVSGDRKSLLFALLTGLPALFSNWSLRFFQHHFLLLVHLTCSGLFFAVATVIILRHLLKQKVVTVDLIWGAVCGYFLIGFMWGDIFAILEIVQPGSFSLGQQDGSFIDSLFYFSFVTLTTLGYGDIVPLTRQAHSLAIVEAILGQMYLAVNIAALVAIRISQKRDTVS